MCRRTKKFSARDIDDYTIFYKNGQLKKAAERNLHSAAFLVIIRLSGYIAAIQRDIRVRTPIGHLASNRRIRQLQPARRAGIYLDHNFLYKTLFFVAAQIQRPGVAGSVFDRQFRQRVAATQIQDDLLFLPRGRNTEPIPDPVFGSARDRIGCFHIAVCVRLGYAAFDRRRRVLRRKAVQQQPHVRRLGKQPRPVLFIVDVGPGGISERDTCARRAYSLMSAMLS